MFSVPITGDTHEVQNGGRTAQYIAGCLTTRHNLSFQCCGKLLFGNTLFNLSIFLVTLRYKGKTNNVFSVPIPGDGHEVQNGGRTAQDITGSPHITELGAKGPFSTYQYILVPYDFIKLNLTIFLVT